MAKLLLKDHKSPTAVENLCAEQLRSHLRLSLAKLQRQDVMPWIPYEF